MSERKTRQQIMDEFRRNSIQRVASEEPANWKDLPAELKVKIIQKMAIPLRLIFRGTARFERNLVDSEGLRSMYVHFDDQRIELYSNYGQQLMIRYKNEQNKFLPFLAYLFKVLRVMQLYVEPQSKWFFEKVCAQVPGGREALKVNFYSDTYYEPKFKEKVNAGVRRFARNILFNTIGNTEPAEYDPVRQLIENWMVEPRMAPPAECLVFDRNPKPMWQLLDIDFEDDTPNRYYSPDLNNYEVGRIRMFINMKHHIYVYKKHGSHWMYIKLIEGSQHERDIKKEDSWSNFSGLTDKLEMTTHEEVRDRRLREEPEKTEEILEIYRRLKEHIPQWR